MSDTWICLTHRERNLLRQALATHSIGEVASANETQALTRKILAATPYPDITIGVYGGQVQWSLGNPFPIRICDYDGEKEDLLQLDERGQRCRMWFEPADEQT